MSGYLDHLPARLREGLMAPRIPAFDGVRGSMMLVIMCSHVLLVPGHVSLLFFFVLSGFLITWLLLEEERKHGRVSLWRFYIRRSLRIFPAYYVALLFIIFVVPSSHGPMRDEHLQSAALYYSNYYQAMYGYSHGAISQFWSLAMEEQFYLLWPSLFLVFRRHRAKVLIGLIVAVWIQRYHIAWVDHDMDWAYHALDCRADHVFLGCLAAVWIHEGCMTRLWALLCRGPAMAIPPAVILVCFTVAAAKWGKPMRLGVAFYVEPIAITCLLVQFIAFQGERGFRWLEWRPFLWVGKISYAVYLYHLLALELMTWWWPMPDPGPDQVLWRLKALLPVSVISLVMGQISWWLVEHPALRLKRRFGG